MTSQIDLLRSSIEENCCSGWIETRGCCRITSEVEKCCLKWKSLNSPPRRLFCNNTITRALFLKYLPGTTWYNHVFPCTMNSTIKSLVLTWDRHVFIYPYLYFHRPTGLWRYFTKIILWQFIVPQRKHCNLKKWLVSPTKKAYQLTTESCSRTNLRTLETEYWKWHLYR